MRRRRTARHFSLARERPVLAPVQERHPHAESRRCGTGMRKALSVGDLREQVKLFKIIVVVNAALLGLEAVELLWTWSSRPDLARRDIVIINAFFGVSLVTNVLLFRRFKRQLDSLAGIEHSSSKVPAR